MEVSFGRQMTKGCYRTLESMRAANGWATLCESYFQKQAAPDACVLELYGFALPKPVLSPACGKAQAPLLPFKRIFKKFSESLQPLTGNPPQQPKSPAYPECRASPGDVPGLLAGVEADWHPSHAKRLEGESLDA